MKRISVFALMVLILFLLPFNALATQPIKVFIDGQQISFTTPPIIEKGTTLVEFRPVFEKLGLSVSWDKKTQTVTGQKKGLTIKLKVGSKTATVNGQNKTLIVAPKIVKNRTFVPLRFIGEATGKVVTWDGQTNTVYIGNFDVVKNKIFNLSDEAIVEAIAEGKKGAWYVNTQISPQYKLSLIENRSIYDAEAWILTPFYNITMASALKAGKYEELSVKEARQYCSDSVIGFYIEAYGGTIDMAKNFHTVLKQGDKIIQPITIKGKDKLANTSYKWPEDPAYITSIQSIFSTSQIDFSKSATLIFIYSPDLEVSYTIDFSKYK